MARLLNTLALSAAFAGLPLAALIHNRLEPNYSSALGVAYAFLFGVALGLVCGMVWILLAWRWPVFRPHWPVVGIVALSVLIGFLVGNTGALSVVR